MLTYYQQIPVTFIWGQYDKKYVWKLHWNFVQISQGPNGFNEAVVIHYYRTQQQVNIYNWRPFYVCPDKNIPAKVALDISVCPINCLWGSRKYPGWRHQMETFSALLALCAGNPPVIGGFPAQRPVTRGFDVFFGLRMSWISRSLWRYCNVVSWRFILKHISAADVQIIKVISNCAWR